MSYVWEKIQKYANDTAKRLGMIYDDRSTKEEKWGLRLGHDDHYESDIGQIQTVMRLKRQLIEVREENAFLKEVYAENLRLRNKYPSVQKAWEQYQLMLKLVQEEKTDDLK